MCSVYSSLAYGWGLLISRMPIIVFRCTCHAKSCFTCYWQGRFYEYNRMPYGYAQAPLLFTKLLKQPFGFLQKQGLLSVIYLDDSYLLGDSYSSCLHNITTTTSLLTALGFKIFLEKSVLIPTQTIKFLGFILNSITMTISLPELRQVRIICLCKKLREVTILKIRKMASTIGTLVSALPAVSHSGLHYRALEHAKNAALQSQNGNFNKKMSILPDGIVTYYGGNKMSLGLSPLYIVTLYTFHYILMLVLRGGVAPMK